jgi:hypothetical protein
MPVKAVVAPNISPSIDLRKVLFFREATAIPTIGIGYVKMTCSTIRDQHWPPRQGCLKAFRLTPRATIGTNRPCRSSLRTALSPILRGSAQAHGNRQRDRGRARWPHLHRAHQRAIPEGGWITGRIRGRASWRHSPRRPRTYSPDDWGASSWSRPSNYPAPPTQVRSDRAHLRLHVAKCFLQSPLD